jgi:D-glycero-alpha-D-manno-heptose-7-phosphate kinase
MGGGGTDLSSYYEKYEGFFIAGAINRYIYVSLSRPFSEGIILKYSKIETVKKLDDIQHPIIREALKIFDLKIPQIEISTIADVPSGTGLGSSGSFTTCLLKALFAHNRKVIHAHELAELACEIEILKLKESIGKQDQYISAFGGITSFTIKKNGIVVAEPLSISNEVIMNLEDNLLLFYTGKSRNAGQILDNQKRKTEMNDEKIINSLHFTKELGLQSKELLEKGEVEKYGQIMHKHWEHKKINFPETTNSQINNWYEIGINSGALGGKLVGAGGGGFLLFYAHDKSKLRSSMKEIGLQELRFGFDFDGTKVIL